MKKNTMRLLTALLALAMLVGMLPAALAAGSGDEKATAAGNLVITKYFDFVDDEDQPVDPDPTCLEGFSMTVTGVMAQKATDGEVPAEPTVTYDASLGRFTASAGSITQLTEAVGYVWTLNVEPMNYVIEESKLFGYKFLGNEWYVNESLAAKSTLSYELLVSEGETKNVEVDNMYRRRYGSIVLSKIIEGITYEQFLTTGATFTLTGPSDFNGGKPMTFTAEDFDFEHYVTNDEIRENHQGIVGYNLKNAVTNAPFGVYTVTESHADYPPYDLKISYGDGQYGDYQYWLKKDAKSADEWDEFGYPPYGENQFIVGTTSDLDYYLTSGKIVIDTYSTYGTIQITKKFSGLEKGVFPDEFAIGLLPVYEGQNEEPIVDDEYRKSAAEPIYFDAFYDEEAGRFVLGRTNGYDVTIEQTRDGFVWTLNDIPTGNYILAEMEGYVQGYKWAGYNASGLTGDELQAAEEFADASYIVVGVMQLQAGANRQIRVTNNYDTSYGYLLVNKELDEDSEPVEIPEGTTFTVRDYDGNEVASLTYKDILKGNNLLKLPTGEYYVEETKAEVEGFAVTAYAEVYDPLQAVPIPSERPEMELKEVEEDAKIAKSAESAESANNAKSVNAVITERNVEIEEKHDGENPIEIWFFNKYTPEADCGTLTIVKQIYGLEELEDGYSIWFEIDLPTGGFKLIEIDAEEFEEKKDDYGDVYFESKPLEVKLPCSEDGQYWVYEYGGEVDYYDYYGYTSETYSYYYTFRMTDPEDEAEVTFINEYYPRNNRGSLSIFTQIKPEEMERYISGNFGFEITGPEDFGEDGKRTVLFSEMVPATEDEDFDMFVDDYSAYFLEQGNWYVYSFYPYPEVQKSRSYNTTQYDGYEYTYVPAGEYTVREVNADISGYTRTTESFTGYFWHEQYEVRGAEVKAIQKRASDPMVLTVGVAKSYEENDAYTAFINSYAQTPDIPDPPPEPTPTPTPTPEPTPEPPETVDVSVEKVWHDVDDTLRPASVSVTLLRNGEATENTATLDAAGSWKYTWTGLEKLDAEGNAYVYTVREDAVPEGYTVTYGGNAESGLTVINTDAGYEELSDDDTPLYGEGDVDDEPLYNPYGVPGTGDESNIPVWACLCALALAGIIVMMIGRRKKEEK